MSTISLYGRPSMTFLSMLHTACGLLPIVTLPHLWSCIPWRSHTCLATNGETQVTRKESFDLGSAPWTSYAGCGGLGYVVCKACIYIMLIIIIICILHQSLFVSCLGTCTRQRCASRPYIFSMHISRHWCFISYLGLMLCIEESTDPRANGFVYWNRYHVMLVPQRVRVWVGVCVSNALQSRLRYA